MMDNIKTIEHSLKKSNELERLGFKLGDTLDQTLANLQYNKFFEKPFTKRPNTTRVTLYRRASELNKPELKLEIFEYPVTRTDGNVNITITSVPFSEEYRFATGNTIPRDEFLSKIEAYLKERRFI